MILTLHDSGGTNWQVVERALSKLQRRAAVTPGARAIGVVRLFGLVHADERTAFKACSRPSAQHGCCMCSWRSQS